MMKHKRRSVYNWWR